MSFGSHRWSRRGPTGYPGTAATFLAAAAFVAGLAAVAGASFGLEQRPPNPTCIAPARPLFGTAAKVALQFGGLVDGGWLRQRHNEDSGEIAVAQPGQKFTHFFRQIAGIAGDFAMVGFGRIQE